jgi:hypothetical protein
MLVYVLLGGGLYSGGLIVTWLVPLADHLP